MAPSQDGRFEDLPDERMMAESLKGSTAALEHLYQRYARRILRFTYRLVQDYHDAESITQEVFLRLLKDSAAYDPGRRFSTWIFTIARNLCLDVRARRRPEAIGDGDRFASRAPDPARDAHDREVADRLHAALDALPPSSREIIQLRMVEQLPYREIAEILGCPESTARSRMNLAIKRLRARLGRAAIPSANLVDESASGP